MKYFKNSELTRIYNVSDKAVRNWILLATQQKINLKLYVKDTRVFIADTVNNRQIIEQLVVKGRKYRNNRSHRNIIPQPEFYELFTPSQVAEIINNLEQDHELLWKYMYFGEGGSYWNDYLNKLFAAGKGNLLTNTIHALQMNYSYLDSILAQYQNVNIINTCVGNFLNAKDLVRHVYDSGKLRRLVGIDISPTMLDISEKHVEQWFNGELILEKYIRDLDFEPIHDILTKDSYKNDASSTINLVLFLAGPIKNFKNTDRVLQTFRSSLGKDDLLLTTFKRDTLQAREFFDFNIESDKKLFNIHDTLLLHLLNIDESFFEVEQLFDPVERLRRFQVRLKIDLSIQFKLGNFQKTVHLTKGDVLLLVRVWHFSDDMMIRHFHQNRFKLQLVATSLDDELMLLATRIRSSLEL